MKEFLVVDSTPDDLKRAHMGGRAAAEAGLGREAMPEDYDAYQESAWIWGHAVTCYQMEKPKPEPPPVNEVYLCNLRNDVDHWLGMGLQAGQLREMLEGLLEDARVWRDTLDEMGGLESRSLEACMAELPGQVGVDRDAARLALRNVLVYWVEDRLSDAWHTQYVDSVIDAVLPHVRMARTNPFAEGALAAGDACALNPYMEGVASDEAADLAEQWQEGYDLARDLDWLRGLVLDEAASSINRGRVQGLVDSIIRPGRESDH